MGGRMSQLDEAGRPTAQVAVAIVSWNTRDLLDACLRSLQLDAEAGLVEVWVVDNASSDGSAEMVRERHPWARLVASEENLGFGAAVNLVASRTDCPWIAPANADIELTPSAMRAMLTCGGRYPGAGIIAPRLVLPDGQTQHSVYSFPTVPFTILFNTGLAGLSSSVADRLALEGSWQADRPRFVDWAIGAFLLVRRAAWDAIGGFDDQQWMYAEDLDLGWRMAQAGWSTRYEPNAKVLHHSSAATIQAWGDARRAQWMRSTYAWMWRRRGSLRTRATAIINIAGAAWRAPLLARAARRRGAPGSDGLREAWRWMRLHAQGLIRRSSLERHR
jgi:GT2 family glycosyltransferase